MGLADIINSLGVTLILLAFLLLTIKRVKQEDKLYNGLNLVGSALACIGAYMIGSIPFLALNVIWVFVAGFALVRKKGS